MRSQGPLYDFYVQSGAILYMAGQKVPAGTYRQMESGHEVRLDHDDRLPASYDGHVAVYVRLFDTPYRPHPAKA